MAALSSTSAHGLRRVSSRLSQLLLDNLSGGVGSSFGAVNAPQQVLGSSSRGIHYSSFSPMNRPSLSPAGIFFPASNGAPLASSHGPIFALSEIDPYGIRFASSLAVRNRMKSVRSIQKITKAMKMVAASKLRGVQSKAEQSRGLWQPFTALMGDNTPGSAEKNVVISVSTDRGLCGGINSTVVKHSRAIKRALELDPERTCRFVVIGEKGKAQLQRDSRADIDLTVTESSKLPVNFTSTSMIVDEILKNVEFDAAHVIFNRFNSVISFVPTISTVLSPEYLSRDAPLDSGKSLLEEYEIEGEESKAELMQNLAEFKLAATLYNAQLENACSEQGARMSAMDSSSRNASDMLDRLTLSYNRSRQASITTELIEIISGASALEG